MTRRRVTPPLPAESASVLIPVRKSAQPWKERSAGTQARNEILRTTKRLDRATWKKRNGYHRRSLVETKKMRCFKLLGERVMARDFDRQVAELQIRTALLNRFTQLGTPQTVRLA